MKILTLTAFACLLLPTAEGAQILTNGGFESGFTGWGRADAPGSDGTFVIQSGASSPVTGDTVPLPPQGTNAAMSDGGAPGSHVLWQNFMVAAPAGQVLLSFELFIGNRADLFATPTGPESLDFGLNRANQQVRVDILAGTADNFSIGVLQNIYQSNAGNALVSGYNRITMDITSLVNANLSTGLRLRFAEVDNLGPLQAGIDNVMIDVTAGAVPEPSTFLLLAAGLLGAWEVRRRRVS